MIFPLSSCHIEGNPTSLGSTGSLDFESYWSPKLFKHVPISFGKKNLCTFINKLTLSKNFSSIVLIYRRLFCLKRFWVCINLSFIFLSLKFLWDCIKSNWQIYKQTVVNYKVAADYEILFSSCYTFLFNWT